MARTSSIGERALIARRFGTPSSFRLPDWCEGIVRGSNGLYNALVERTRYIDTLVSEYVEDNPECTKPEKKLVRETAKEVVWGAETPTTLRAAALHDPDGLQGAWGTATKMLDMFTAAQQRTISVRSEGRPAELRFRSTKFDPWVLYHQVQGSPTVADVTDHAVRGFRIEMNGRHAIFHIDFAPRAGIPKLSIPIAHYGRKSNRLPDDWIVKSVTITGTPIPSRTGRKIQVSVTCWRPAAEPATGGDIFVATQWTALGGGATQVATILPGEGVPMDLSNIGSPFLDFDSRGYIHVQLPVGGLGFRGPARADYERVTNDLRSIRAQSLVKMQKQYPEDPLLRIAKSANHLSSLILQAGDAAPEYLQLWRHDPANRSGDAHLASWERHGVRQFLDQRDDLYRRVAKALCTSAGRIILQSHPSAGQREREDDPVNADRIRRNKAFVAPGRFASILESTASRLGVTVVKEDWLA